MKSALLAGAALVLCVVVQGLPFSQDEYTQQLGDSAPSPGQADWANAVKQYKPSPSAWQQAAQAATPAALSAMEPKASLPSHAPMGNWLNNPDKKVDAAKATRDLTNLEQKQVNTAQLQQQRDHMKEEKLEAKIAGLKLVDAESRSMDRIDVENKERVYQKGESVVQKDKIKVNHDEMNAVQAKMMVGTPEVGSGHHSEASKPTHFYYPGISGQPGMGQ